MEILQYVILKWSFVFLVAVLTGSIGFLINLAVENIAGAKYLWNLKLMQEKWYVRVLPSSFQSILCR
jgi:chloride channel 7